MREPDAPPVGPIEQGLEEIWGRYRSSWRRLLSRGAVKELVLRASFDPDLIAPWRIANRIPKGTVPDCPKCTNICCAGLENVVSLRLRDVAMLLDLGRDDLMSKLKPNFPAWMLEERPTLKELVASELWRSLPVMRQVGELSVCAALDTNTLKCSLHPAWPTSCERFPYSLDVARRQVNWGSRCPSKKVHREHQVQSDALFEAAIDAYNRRVQDAVLLAHARPELEALGLGPWLTGKDEDPFEPRPKGLEVVR